MSHSTLSRLQRFSDLVGVSGREGTISRLLQNEMEGLVDEIRSDAMGNLVGLKHGTGSELRLMIAAHMDEIGMVVTGYEGSFLRFTRIGGINTRLLPGTEVRIHSSYRSGETSSAASGEPGLPGIVGTRPPHLIPPAERRKPMPLEDLFIDVGLNEKALKESVTIGDWISFDQKAEPLGNGAVTGKALDNRISLAVMLAALEHLSSVNHLWDVYAVATTQEEVGLRGVTSSAFHVDPHLGVALDVTFADQPGVSNTETVKWDRGPAIGIGPNLHPGLRRLLVERARQEEIPFVDEVLPGHSGTDAWALQVTRSGVPTALLSVPIRNMHSGVEVARIADVDRTARLLARFIAGLDEKTMDQIRFI